MLLAAGSSRRLGRSKARLPWGPDDASLTVRAVREGLAASRVEGVVVVVPPHDEALGDLARDVDEARVRVVVNEAAAAGMGSSIAAGVRLVEAEPADFVVLLAVDQPLIGAAQIAALAGAIAAGAPAAAAAYEGVTGVPAAFARAWFGALCQLQGDRGARRLLRDDPIDGLATIAMPEAAIDVDTEAGYAAARAERIRLS